MSTASSAPASSSTSKINVLLIGTGGREHALAWKLRQSPRLGTLFLSDNTNPGLTPLGTPVDVPVDIKQIYRLQQFCDKNNVGLVVIGPEEPLAQGYADALASKSRVVFGPTKDCARLEADKAWCKQLLRTAAIPTAEGRTFTDAEQARAYIESRVHDEPALATLFENASKYRDSADRRKFIQRAISTDPAVRAAYLTRHDDLPVIKASGLAKGKGVILPSTLMEAVGENGAIDRIMVKLEFGEAGRTVVIEEKLEGKEVSVLAITDGRTLYVLEPCQDHKRLGDNDTGPNTGGMGVICPGGIVSSSSPASSSDASPHDALMNQIQSEILVPTLDAMRREGLDYRGVLYAGIMLTPAGPKVLEFNCRFGDPECQALMARFDADLIDVMLAVGTRSLDDAEIAWSPAASCVVVLAAGGYPGKPKMHVPIRGLDLAAKVPGVQIFHSGTRVNENNEVVTAGGRVLSITATGATMPEARKRAYEAASMIQFEGKQMRTDIGAAAGTVRSSEVAAGRR
jgi:phosphoribosylamine--glycine ligase